MTQSHTPGPWIVSRNSQNMVTVYPKRAGTKPIAYFYSDGGELPEYIRPIKQVEANARLIAASPELLDLLISTLPYIEEGEEFNKSTGKKLSKKIRAVIERIENA